MQTMLTHGNQILKCDAEGLSLYRCVTTITKLGAKHNQDAMVVAGVPQEILDKYVQWAYELLTSPLHDRVLPQR